MVLRVEIFEVSGNENTSALARGFGLGDEGFAVLFLFLLFCLISELLFEVSELCWQEPSLWKEFIFLGEDLLKTVQVPS